MQELASLHFTSPNADTQVVAGLYKQLFERKVREMLRISVKELRDEVQILVEAIGQSNAKFLILDQYDSLSIAGAAALAAALSEGVGQRLVAVAWFGPACEAARILQQAAEQRQLVFASAEAEPERRARAARPGRAPGADRQL